MAQGATGSGSGDGTAPPPDEGAPQQLVVNAQYIKDLSFENPRAPHSLMQQSGMPAIDIKVDVKAQNLSPETFEVVLTINAGAKTQQGEALFLIELAYAALVTAHNVPQPVLTAAILVETPRLLFPFARNIIADATRDGGFPPLMINPIDFAELLRREQAAAAAAASPAASP
jgi:preprotein translocase subunit SecB